MAIRNETPAVFQGTLLENQKRRCVDPSSLTRLRLNTTNNPSSLLAALQQQPVSTGSIMSSDGSVQLGPTLTLDQRLQEQLNSAQAAGLVVDIDTESICPIPSSNTVATNQSAPMQIHNTPVFTGPSRVPVEVEAKFAKKQCVATQDAFVNQVVNPFNEGFATTFPKEIEIEMNKNMQLAALEDDFSICSSVATTPSQLRREQRLQFLENSLEPGIQRAKDIADYNKRNPPMLECQMKDVESPSPYSVVYNPTTGTYQRACCDSVAGKSL